MVIVRERNALEGEVKDVDYTDIIATITLVVMIIIWLDTRNK